MDTFSGAAQQAGASRLMGGIHIQRDNTDGLALGATIGNAVIEKLRSLAPSALPDVTQRVT